jgi:hypothetical protein
MAEYSAIKHMILRVLPINFSLKRKGKPRRKNSRSSEKQRPHQPIQGW